MHMLGGLWVSLFTLSIYEYFCDDNISNTNCRKKIFYIVFLVLLFIAISWEIFELVGKITFLNDGIWYWFDTTKDIIDDLIGGIIGYVFYIKKIINRI